MSSLEITKFNGFLFYLFVRVIFTKFPKYLKSQGIIKMSTTIQLPLSNDQPMSTYNKVIWYTPLVPTCDNDPSCPCQHARPHQAQGK
jgi:hypothetical protein